MTLLFAAFAEKSTNNVIDFFLGTKWRFIRCHRNFKKSSSYEPIDILKEKLIYFWYRKGEFNSDYNIPISQNIDTYIGKETRAVFEFTISEFEQRPHIGNYFQRFPNKLTHLSIAQKVGVYLPEWIIATKKEEVQRFKGSYKFIINKSLSDSFKGTFDRLRYYNHTERVSDEHIEKLDEEFFPTRFPLYSIC